MEDIYLLTPINRTASLVTNQSGCEDEMSLEDERDCVYRSLQATEKEILGLPKKHDYRKELGIKKLYLQQEISKINKKIKVLNVFNRDINDYVIQILRESMPRDKWIAVLKKAEEKKAFELESVSNKK